MIVVDSSAVYAALDRGQAAHAAVAEVIRNDPGPFLLSPFVLAEVDYFLLTRMGPAVERRFLQEVADGGYDLVDFDADDVAAAIKLIDRHADLKLGIADASLAVVADRYGIDRILTLDRRHFRAVRTLHDGGPFELLPHIPD